MNALAYYELAMQSIYALRYTLSAIQHRTKPINEVAARSLELRTVARQ